MTSGTPEVLRTTHNCTYFYNKQKSGWMDGWMSMKTILPDSHKLCNIIPKSFYIIHPSIYPESYQKAQVTEET